MATPSFTRDESHSTTLSTGGWSSSRIAVTAVFCALALVTSFIEIPIFPPAPYLKYDPSGIVAMVAGFAFGPGTGVAVGVISWLLHLLVRFDPYGIIMAILAIVSYVLPAALINAKDPSPRKALVGMCVGSVVAVVVCILGNLVITPLYTGMATEAVAAMIVPILLPFNLLKVVLNTVVVALLYRPVTAMLKR